MTHSQQLQVLDELLTASRALWQVKAFDAMNLPWEQDFPTLAAAVWQLADEQIESIDVDRKRLLETLLPPLQQDLAVKQLNWPLDLFECRNVLTALEASQCQSADNVSGLNDTVLPHFSAHIKGRKWQQIVAFNQAISRPANTADECQTEVLEWCAGKGHLGRLVAKAQRRKVVSLEWQQALCDNGSEFAKRWALPQSFICADAFSEQTADLFKQNQQAIALHACGDLHVTMLHHAVKAKTAAISFSPCCYHLIQAKAYQGLSNIARASGLNLSRHDLQLPLQQSVIANDKAKQLRLKEIAWRLGFDSLQRDITGSESYLPIPSIKQSQLSGDFSAFCHWAAAQKGLELPDTWSAQYYLEIGLKRQRLTRRIDLVAHLFRDILEQWLLLDRVCFLEEAGYQVSLSQFCPEHVTPRNGFISAQRIKN
ncbi:methyltransferase [Shewanella sp. Isolate11]|uniref:methyltransferase n=1 Tax=Shewanella sp. Isolate11 TaxID=2908530 RepID=UPI001EFC9480|nr:methyltransferase [Shewanella sp. Isolate11]MCG9696417.1 SAM-dependent methyltransferase [Shewanella sp. Isolate11]